MSVSKHMFETPESVWIFFSVPVYYSAVCYLDEPVNGTMFPTALISSEAVHF